MFNKCLSAAALSLLLLLSSGCFHSSTPKEQERSAVKRPHNTHARVIELRIPKGEFVAAARNIDQIRRIRLIEVTASEETGRSSSPEYRLFNIPPKSAYALLGLEDGDVLVAANDYALNDPEVFKQYVQVLHVESGETFIEIRRNGEEIVLEFSFI